MIRCLGVDTSNYRTSVALTEYAENGSMRIVNAYGKLLDVKAGERGLRQSAALFQQVKNLPLVFRNSGIRIDGSDGSDSLCVACSTKPRPEKGSYMPVFLAGESFAMSLGSVLNVPVYRFSHQEGHIAAAAYDRLPSDVRHLAAFHFSGGTTEMLLVNRNADGQLLSVRKIGGTLDLSFGQLLDRVGVLAGIHFPAGRELDQIAASGSEDKTLIPKIHTDGLYWNVSGIETKAERLLQTNINLSVLSRTLFERMGEVILSVIKEASEKFDVEDFLFSGGVSQSQTLRQVLGNHGTRMTDPEKGAVLRSGQKLWFGRPELCGDNAVGISLLGGQRHAAETGFCHTAE
ncbi:MAG: peptidase M22 [Eubacteriales bacterium]|nr:peptidase M22 [Eubacteriales bacterium]